jgi:hypothetical protein
MRESEKTMLFEFVLDRTTGSKKSRDECKRSSAGYGKVNGGDFTVRFLLQEKDVDAMSTYRITESFQIITGFTLGNSSAHTHTPLKN